MNPSALNDRIVALATEWADANAEADWAENVVKIKFSELVNNLTDNGSPTGKAEHCARTHPAYKEAVGDAIQKRTVANIAKAKLEAAKLAVEIWRTQESTKRAEMNMR